MPSPDLPPSLDFRDVALWGGTAFVVAGALTPVARALARSLGAVDRPDDRRAHQGDIPTLGGLAVLLSLLATFVVAGWMAPSGLQTVFAFDWPLLAFGAGATVVAVVGAIDDIVGLNPRTKLIGQALAALIAVTAGFGFSAITHPISGGVVELGWFGWIASFVWIVAITNAFNLIDGLDGLAAGVGIIACATMALVSVIEARPDVMLLAIALGGALLGFLPYNFHPASIFLGDSGSLLIGYSLALLSVRGLQKGTTLVVVLVPFLTLGLPILDTLVTILRRYFVAGFAAVFRADREHLHHRLLALGFTHQRAVLVLYGAGLLFGLLALMIVTLHGPIKAILLALAALGTYVAIRKLGYRP